MKLLSEGIKSDALFKCLSKQRSCVSHTPPALKTRHTTEFAILAEFVNWQRKG
jgi:hypothetical protein